MGFSILSYVTFGAAVCFLWLGIRFFGKRGRQNRSSSLTAESSPRIPRGVSVYLCDTSKSYEDLPAYLDWVTHREGIRTKAVVLQIRFPIVDESDEWRLVVRVMESLHDDIYLVIVTNDENISDLLEETVSLKQSKCLSLFESMQDAIDYLEIELS